MLTRLESRDIVAMWDVIEEGLRRSIDPDLIEKDNNFNGTLKKLLDGRLVIWLSRKDLDALPSGFIITTLQEDDIINERSLLIYAIANFKTGSNAQEWFEGAEAIIKYAKWAKCKRIVFYTKNDKIIKIFNTLQMGKVSEYRLCIAEL